MKKNSYTALSLFDGMSCGQIALKELGIKVDKYYASETDKHAIKQTQLNFPDTIQLGSVVNVDVSKLDRIDLLLGGSPCQSFSFAGKRKGMAAKIPTEKQLSDIKDLRGAGWAIDEKEFVSERIDILTLDHYLELKSDGFEFEGQSYLFWEYVRILVDIRKYNPDVKFLLENVEMGSKWERVISEAIGLFGIHINSALVSAQNRRRIYWTNIRTRQEGLFGEIHSDIPQPEDRGILLRDILEDNVEEKYYLSDKIIAGFNNKPKGWAETSRPFQRFDVKSKCVNSRISKMGAQDNYISIDAAALTPRRTEYGKLIRRDYEAGRVSEQRKNIQRLEPRSDGKTNTLTSVQKDNLILQRGRGFNKGGLHEDKSPTLSSNSWEQNNLVVSMNESHSQSQKIHVNADKSVCLSGRGGGGGAKTGLYSMSDRIRRLTPLECARLQTIPEWYKWECSDTQAYKMCGNGWTIEVIKHILKHLKHE